jgi:LuxR family maltose regulon positive regulatory protein
VSLDAQDNDPRRFWPLIGGALVAAGVLAAADDFAALTDANDDPARIVTALQDALPVPAEVVLVVDDAHLISHPDLIAQLDVIIRYGHPRLRLVLGARSDPLLPLHRYRLAGQMTELRAADLAMTRREARALLGAHGVTLPGRALAVLARRTEGWTAGLRLSAMSMAGSPHPERFVTALGVGPGGVGEYLIEEVLARQPADVRQLLIQTSFLDEVTGPLAAAITDLDSAAELLAELARTNSFVDPVDESGTWYRYHHLLRDVLHYLLLREYPGKEQEFRHRAAVWYQQHHQPAIAMRFAVSADDWQHVAELLVHGGLVSAFVTRLDLLALGVGGLAEALSPDAQAAEPAQPAESTEPADAAQSLALAAVAALRGDGAGALAGLERARAVELAADAREAAALVELLVAIGDGRTARVDAAAVAVMDALAEPTAGTAPPALRAAVCYARAGARYWNGGPRSDVDELLLDAITDARRAGEAGLELESLGMLQLNYAWTGRADHARECAASTQDLIRQHPQLRRTTAHHLAQALSSGQHGELVAAERSLRRATNSMAVDADPPLQAAVVLAGADLAVQRGHVADAYRLLRTAPELDRPLPDTILRYRDLTLADIETRLGRPHSALKVTGTDPDRSGDPLVALAAARAYLALGDAPAARRFLRPALISAESTMPLPLLVAVLLASATVADRAGDDVLAAAEALRACDLAGPHLRRPFADMQQALAALLDRHPELRERWPQPVIVSSDEASPTSAADRLPEPLTDREIAVLRRLATTMTTQEIAHELCVSINTVKTHIAAIYRKLPAAGRRDAVARAWQLELL